MCRFPAFLVACVLVAVVVPPVAIGQASSVIVESIIAPATEESPRNSEGDLVLLEDGSILAAWSEFYGGNRDDSAARISAKRSTDGGRTWSEKRTLVENTGRENVMSASLLRLASGDLCLFYLEKNSRSDLNVVVRRSSDEGESWSDPTLITRDGGYWVMNNARVAQLSTGRVVCPTAMTEEVWVKGHTFRTVCFYSDDDGTTWRRGVGGVAAPQRGAMEPGLMEMKDGRLLQYIRTQMGKQWFAESTDGGDTWTQSQPWTVVSPEAPATVARMPANRGWVVLCNPNVDPSAGHLGRRTPLVAMTSADEGETWSKQKAVEADPNQTFSYASVDFMDDRALLTYYVSDAQRRISWKFKSMPLNWFPKPPPPALKRLDRDNLLEFHASDGSVRLANNAADWQIRRAEILEGMQSVMGALPGEQRRVDLETEIIEEADAGSYVRRLVSYQSEPDSRAIAYLCIPKSAMDGSEPAAAVLCLHPTDNLNGHKVVVGLGGKPNRQYAAELAERGFITIAPAYPLLAGYAPNLGRLGYVSGTMKAIWDNSRALDLLQSLPQVDATKGFGAIGHSLGGHNAIFTAALDNRISVVVSSCGFDAFSDYYDGAEENWYFGKGWCQTRYMPRMSNYRGDLESIPFDFTELLGVLCPRSIFINAPLGDSNFRWKSVDRCVEASSPIDKLLGVENRIEVHHPDCKHDFPESIRRKAYKSIERVLK